MQNPSSHLKCDRLFPGAMSVECSLLYFVLPCYNEEQEICGTIASVKEKLERLEKEGKVAPHSVMLFVDEGTVDQTWRLISAAHASCPEMVKAVRLAGNRGKEYAMWAGVMAARQYADVVVTMDADLQFDLEAVDEFLAFHAQGYDLVYGLKQNRGQNPLHKKSGGRDVLWAYEAPGCPHYPESFRLHAYVPAGVRCPIRVW